MISQSRPNISDSEFQLLRDMSARFGQDVLHIQGAGGNVSIKADDVMWIKASGTMLCDAAIKDIFVPVDLPGMQSAIKAREPETDSHRSRH